MRTVSGNRRATRGPLRVGAHKPGYVGRTFAIVAQSRTTAEQRAREQATAQGLRSHPYRAQSIATDGTYHVTLQVARHG